MEFVMAVVLLITGLNETTDLPTFEFVTSAKMTTEECLSSALEFNKDASHPYLMVCTPEVTSADIQS